MTPKPQQRSVAIVDAIRSSINGTIDTLLDSLSVQAEQLEQAFMTELAYLDETYTDQENDDTALEQVQLFDKGYAKTMAAIQAATERLIEARAHIARVTNTIEFHPAFTGNGYKGDGEKLGDTVSAPIVYQLGPNVFDKNHQVSWIAMQELMNGRWPFSERDREILSGKQITLSSDWQCPVSNVDARALVILSVSDNQRTFEIVELYARVDGKNIEYRPVSTEVDGKIVTSIAPSDCLSFETTTKETNHE